MHCAGQHKPYAEWHKPYAEWHKPCRYYRLLFRNLQAPAADSRHRFLRLSACPYHNPTGPSADGLCRRFPWAVFDNPHRSAVGLLLLASVVVSVGRSQPPSPPPDWDFRRFPLCGPLSRTAAEIFTGSLGATRLLWKLPRRRLTHFWGACAFYLLSMVSLHTKTSFLTKPHGSKLSLSSFYGLSHGTGQPLP